MKKTKILLPFILVVMLAFSITNSHLSHLKTAFAAVEEGKVVITGLTVNKSEVTAGSKVAINATFEGGKNVQPNTTLEINLPQRTTDLAGLYGVNTTFTINGFYNEGQEDQKEVPNIATVQIKDDKAIVTFNESVKDLPNGFTGHFTFNAEAQVASNITEGSQQTTITVDGQEVTITINKGQSSGGSGTESNKPIDDSKEYLKKYGGAGKSGNINWVIAGCIPGDHVGNVIITDIPSGASGKISTPTFNMTIRKNVTSNGEVTSSQATTYNFKQLQELGYITLKDDGGFIITIPAEIIDHSQWEIRYRVIPDESITEGEVFENKVSVTTNEKTIETSHRVEIQQGGSGSVNGSGSSSTVESSSESTDSTTSSTEEVTVPEESTTSTVESSSESTDSTTSSIEEVTVPKNSNSDRSDVTNSTSVSDEVTSSSITNTTETTTSVRQNITNKKTIIGDNLYSISTTTRTSSNSHKEGMLLPQTGTKRAIGLIAVGVILIIGIVIYIIIRRRF